MREIKRIGIVHYTAPPTEVGGVEIVISAHLDFFVRRGYKVHLIYGSGGDYGSTNVIEHRIPLLSPKSPEVIAVQEELLKKGEVTQSFIELKEKIKGDLREIMLHLDDNIIHNIPSMPFNFAATAAINELADELPTKFIFWIHDIASLRDEWRDRTDSFPFTIFHHKNSNITYVTISNYRAQQLAKLSLGHNLGKIYIIPNGVRSEDFLRFDRFTKELMSKIGVGFQDLVMLVPVRITPRKNIELALSVAHELKHLMEGERKLKILVTGPPDHQAVTMGVKYMEYLVQLVKKLSLEDDIVFCNKLLSYDRVAREGRIVKWNIADVYTISDFVFVPSKEEGFGLPLIEAGAARKIVFVSRIPPFQELIESGIHGFMFDLEESPEIIAHKVFKEFVLEAPDSDITSVVKNIVYRIYKVLVMDVVDPNLGDLVKNFLFQTYKELIMDVLDPNFSYVMDKFTWNTILSKKLVPLL